MARHVATYSIAACDLDAGQWGVAVESKFLAVGSVVAWAEPHVGAIATQAWANPRYGPEGLALLREGLAAEEVVERLTSADSSRHRCSWSRGTAATPSSPTRSSTYVSTITRARSRSSAASTGCTRRSSARHPAISG